MCDLSGRRILKPGRLSERRQGLSAGLHLALRAYANHMTARARRAQSHQRLAAALFALGLADLVVQLLTHTLLFLWPVNVFTMATSVFAYRLNEIILRRELDRQNAARR